MRKMWSIFAVVAVIGASQMMMGCKGETLETANEQSAQEVKTATEQSTSEQSTEQSMEAATEQSMDPATEHPASDKPKDHPAH